MMTKTMEKMENVTSQNLDVGSSIYSPKSNMRKYTTVRQIIPMEGGVEDQVEDGVVAEVGKVREDEGVEDRDI